VYAFTYIVDSDQKLADWANNVSGNNYLSVLIKRGEYHLNGNKRIYINLSTTGTKSIIGEIGSKIIVNSSVTSHLFSYDNLPTMPDFSISSLSIVMTCPTTGEASCIFRNCLNVSHCVGELTQSRYGRIFLGCSNIINCVVVDAQGSGSGYGFLDCLNVKNNKVLSYKTAGYLRSYSSPTANSTYACANTLEGGWNQ
jgi:hypothetical protein